MPRGKKPGGARVVVVVLLLVVVGGRVVVVVLVVEVVVVAGARQSRVDFPSPQHVRQERPPSLQRSLPSRDARSAASMQRRFWRRASLRQRRLLPQLFRAWRAVRRQAPLAPNRSS